jgi:hypothetical protein
MNTNTTLRNTLQAALLTATLLLGIRAAQAQLVTNNIAVPNYSFETSVVPAVPGYLLTGDSTLDPNSVNVANWIPAYTQYAYLVRQSFFSMSGVTGDQYMYLQPGYDGNPQFYQNIGSQYQVGTYTLSVDIGYSSSGGQNAGQNADAYFQLWSQDGAVYTPLGTKAVVSSTTLAAHNGSFVTYSLTLDTLADSAWRGKDIVIRIDGYSPTARGSVLQNVSYDNVQLNYVAAVPEPSTYALVLGGIATLLLIRRRVQS